MVIWDLVVVDIIMEVPSSNSSICNTPLLITLNILRLDMDIRPLIYIKTNTCITTFINMEV